MNNTTQPISSASVTDYLLYAIYTSEGLAICLGNGLLLLAIAFDKALRSRKEMLIIGGLCVADLSYGLGTLFVNIYRVAIILVGQEFSETSAWSCLLMPQFFLAYIGAQWTATMNLLVSVDRYIAVAFPIPYRAMSTKYAWRVLGSVFISILLSSITMYASSYFNAPIFSTFTRMCLGIVLPRWFSLLQYTIITGCGVLSVIVYFFVFLAYRSYIKKVNPGHAVNDQQIHAQRRLTITLGMINVSTLLFFIVPFAILTYYLFIVAVNPLTIPLAILTRISSIVNIVIYVYRQKEVRPAMWKILRCKRHANSESHSLAIHSVHDHPVHRIPIIH